LWRANHFCDSPINFIPAQIKYAFGVRALAPIARCAYLRTGETPAKKTALAKHDNTISEKMRASRIGGGRESIRARWICDYDCAGDVNESGTFPRTHGQGRNAHLAV
jgi:hypothetical protein